jgi:16S rRNA (cytosine967-C5)-methyltransferase
MASGAGEVSSTELVADASVAAVEAALHAVFGEKQRSDRAVVGVIRGFPGLTWADKAWVRAAVHSVFRWHGWVDRLGLGSTEARLVTSILLDEKEVPEVARVLARRCGVEPSRLFALGDAPDWPQIAEGLRRLFDERKLSTDPWLLFPTWLKDILPVPPGEDAPKHRFVRFLLTLQRRSPLWLRSRAANPQTTWANLRDQGLHPWALRSHLECGRFAGRIDLPSLAVARRGEVVVEDLAAQAVVHACDPEPGERWWVAFGGSGEKALHLADRMKGKGTVIISDPSPAAMKAVSEQFRKAERSNFTSKEWDGKHLVGKAGSYRGVLLDAPGTGVGTWRRHPEGRWLTDRAGFDRLSAEQVGWLDLVAKGVKPGGTLVYSTRTVTTTETEAVVEAFLASHPDFQPDPFPPFPAQDGAMPDAARVFWPMAFDSDAVYIARFIRKA